MPDNATLNQRVQIGVESTWGTAVAATKRLQSVTVDVDPQVESDAFTPNGNLFPTSNSLTQEWVEGSVSGILTYTEVVYLLSAALGPATITTPGGGTNSRQWKWSVLGNAELAPKSLTVEKGSATYGTRFAGGLMTGLNFGWSRTDRIEVGGSLMGKAITAGHTMTTISSNATVEIVRVLPQQVSVYNSATWAGLSSASAYTRAFEAGFSLDSLFAPVWPLNAAVTGHDGYVGTAPDAESSLLMMVDATSMGMLSTLRTGGTTYLRIESIGAVIEGAIPYTFRLDMAVQVKDMDAFTDHDGIYAIPMTFQPIDDGTNPTMEITVINKQTAL